MFFTRRKPRLTLEQSLAARPVRVAGASVEEGDGGAGRVTVPLRQARWTGWLFRVPPGSTKTFELDPIGLLVWHSCDGSTSVTQIIRKLARRYNLTEREAEVSTRQFLHTLARKGLIGFATQAGPGVGGSAPGGAKRSKRDKRRKR
jgi:hypothetical protein